MMITVMMIVALYVMIRVADPRHLLFLVDGHDGDDYDNREDCRGAQEIISVADAWHALFLEDGHNGDADDNRGDDRG